MELNKYQFLYIQTMYDYFREKLQWPTFRQVEKKILPTHRDFRVLDVARSFEDNQATHFFYQHLDVPATITLKEIRHYPEAEQDLADLAKVIRYCADKYIYSDEVQVTVTGEEVGRNLHFDETTVRKVGLLLVMTNRIFTAFSNPEQSIWHLTASQDVLDFEGIQSIDDYFERLDERIKSYQASRSSQRSSQNATSIISQDDDTSATIEKIAQADPSDIKAEQLRLLLGYMYRKAPEAKEKDIEAGIEIWTRNLTISQGAGEKLEVALLNALSRLGIPSFFAGSASSGGPETPIFDLVALGFFTTRPSTAILISCKSSKNQPNLGEIGKLSDEAEKVRSVLSGWLVFGTLVVLGEPTAQEFNYRQDIRIWNQSHVQAILHASAREQVDSLIWTPPQHWHPDTESIWRSQYKPIHKG